jgi:RHS repeat-associated protein
LVTDSDKNIISAVTYCPFGETYSEEGSEEYLFNGKEKDATDLYYFGARYYDPETGRFLTRDSLRGNAISPQSQNRYAYCLNNPVKYTDHWGLFEKKFTIEGSSGGPREEEVKKGKAELVDPPEKQLDYEKGFILIDGEVAKQGNVGVATAGYYEYVNDYSMPYFRGKGLVILFYDGDEILDFLFIPFKDIEDEADQREEFTRVINWLTEHGIDLHDFQDVVGALEDKLNSDSNDVNNYGLAGCIGGTIVSIIALFLAPPVGAIAALSTLGYGTASWKASRNLNKWEGIVDDLEDCLAEVV